MDGDRAMILLSIFWILLLPLIARNLENYDGVIKGRDARPLWGLFYAPSFTYGSFIHSMLKPAFGARFLPVESAPVARFAS